jgi:DNA recombination protein RmuC
MLAVVLSALAVALVVVLLVVVLSRPKPKDNEPALALIQQQLGSLSAVTQVMSLLQQQIDALRKQVGDSLSSSASQMNQQLGNITQQFQGTTASISQRLDKAAEVISGVQRGLGEMTEATKRIHDVGQDIAQLQEILRAPKLRGGLGETFLGDLLAQILPREHFELQYRFKTGEVVDAIVRLGGRLVAVDAKFPLENFRKLQAGTTEEAKLPLRRAFARDVKKHVDDIARKYILPDEGTFEFALMFIPAENVYYETIIKDDRTEDEAMSAYALARKVVPVSPNSFYAYLQAIVLGLGGLRIEKRAREIMDTLARLKADFARFREDFETLGKHLTNARGKYEEAEKRLVRFEERLTGVDTPAVENKPDQLTL